MIKSFFFIFLVFLSFISQGLYSQDKIPFGNITAEDLSNKPYLPDPGADAVIISDIGIATLDYIKGFTLNFERDVRIKIVNSNGFDFADIEIPFSSGDKLYSYKASSFNLRNGEMVETAIPNKGFIIEESTQYRRLLKFNFPDVHEGTVVEYKYSVALKDESIYTLIPWLFQNSIPVKLSALVVAYPEFFIYKSVISGNPSLVRMRTTSKNQLFDRKNTAVSTFTWTAQNVPAINDEPFIKNDFDNLTRITFELASVNFPNSSLEEISPTYKTLTRKLLDRDDFGSALEKTSFLAKPAITITNGLNDDLSKVKAIHKYISEKFLWNGDKDFISSSSLRKVFNREKGNSADLNMILIAMLRSQNIKAEPVILCTRSNGTLNQYSAMLQQFNYLVANVSIGNHSFLVDATDPLRPFNMLPADCLNGLGRQISEYESKFVELKNAENSGSLNNIDLSLSPEGNVEGQFSRRNTGYLALDIRQQVKLEGMEGYADMVRGRYSEAEISDYVLKNLSQTDSDIIESYKILIKDGGIFSGDKMLLNPFFSFVSYDNPFISPDRSFPVDFGYPRYNKFSISLVIPDQYFIDEIPDDVTYSIGGNNAKYAFTCTEEGNRLIINSSLMINKIDFPLSEYQSLRDFFAKMKQSQTRFIVLKKKF
jgi:transglutaminase-like putative cysteine protease